jgi:hypothetical protein
MEFLGTYQKSMSKFKVLIESCGLVSTKITYELASSEDTLLESESMMYLDGFQVD